MIHRDIKPENIIVNSCLKIRGFGCAKPLRKPYVPGEMRGHRAAILLTGAYIGPVRDTIETTKNSSFTTNKYSCITKDYRINSSINQQNNRGT
jgi:serine/threonine protein kinase